ncbi:Peptidase S46 [Draconibacterium orientale]|uniref:Dipeptidyl-peptidase n=1 Tax=Draconibacterium orientale TaxID=1168034 RepID=X5DK12_9BACT|nr:S46 family peptidase [Draconibacterium orientale]AHW60867.1 peptidase S46 [Draconibacterium orientale]SES66160.1 Peptidase S46 [Draconibacterium orientale]
MMKKSLLLVLLVFSLFQLSAKEGMWIPILLEKYNLAEMQEMGFKLSADDIYDVNHSSMKDAVVIFGGGCTGELISDEGLLITNHHCGYRQIQSHSTVEHDYLTNGFWAMSRDEELPNERLTVSFLEYMKDVTDSVLAGTENMDGEAADKKIKENTDRIIKEARNDGKFTASVKPLFYGNQYFLYVYKVYKDVRLVGAPPSAIGKFGGDTDNWMWPRHTGDFSLFRIYADKNNEPAEYSPDNVPFKPKKSFPVSMKGIQPGDFTMVFGNPGTTMQYWPHQAVDVTMNQRDPDRIMLRDKKLDIIGSDMESDPKIRIQYAAKYAGISNAWKKWQGEIKGLKRLDAINKKRDYEEEFKKWAQQNNTWENKYKPVFDAFDVLYADYSTYIKAYDYYREIVMSGVEVFKGARTINSIINNIENDQDERAESMRSAMLKGLPGFYKDFNQPTDEALFATLMPELINGLDASFLPAEVVETIRNLDQEKLVKKVYQKSILTDRKKLEDLLENGSEKQLLKLRKDPLISMFNQLNFIYEKDIMPEVRKISKSIDDNMKVYMAGLMEMKKGQAFYPDANLTLRVAYGQVEGYEPKDGVKYKYYTTLTGIMEKDNPEIYDYDVPDRLKELYHAKDFGQYEVNGDVPVCFTASNHTTGGNSGSPVVNGNGELIGVNFDRCWEGTMSDIMFDPERCRNISLDIRYALFIIDKFAGAGYLLEEMEIVK